MACTSANANAPSFPGRMLKVRLFYSGSFLIYFFRWNRDRWKRQRHDVSHRYTLSRRYAYHYANTYKYKFFSQWHIRCFSFRWRGFGRPIENVPESGFVGIGGHWRKEKLGYDPAEVKFTTWSTYFNLSCLASRLT